MSQDFLIELFMDEFKVPREQAEELLYMHERTEIRELEYNFQYCMNHE